MIECELCGEYFHADDIDACPKCGIELCEGCYQTHVTKCMLSDFEDEENDNSCNKYPHECPKCGCELELDIGFNEPSKIYCTNPECDFEMEYEDIDADDE